MKVTLFMMFVCAFQLVAATGKAQNAVVKLSSNTVTVETLFAEIEKQTEYLVVFRNQELNPNATVTLKNKEGKVGEILDEVLEGTNLQYEHTGKNYIVFSRKTDGTNAGQQNSKTITGVVKDKNGEPVIGANVLIKGQARGAITDLDGRFTLEVPSNAILQISFIGYTTQEVAVTNRTHINVILNEDAAALEEVVVVGYGTMKKKDLTGAVKRVNLEDAPTIVNTNISQALVGATAGVNTTQSGYAGGDVTLSIRGAKSFSASQTPLVVLDGIIYNGSMADINVNDVSSIDILKDASAAAVYGARSANGVILITTKKGKTEKPVVSFNMSLGTQGASNHKTRYMDAEEYVMRLVGY